jgi:hypothetical protein
MDGFIQTQWPKQGPKVWSWLIFAGSMRVTDVLGPLASRLQVCADVEEVAFGVGEGGDGAVVLGAAGAEFGSS